MLSLDFGFPRAKMQIPIAPLPRDAVVRINLLKKCDPC